MVLQFSALEGSPVAGNTFVGVRASWVGSWVGEYGGGFDPKIHFCTASVSPRAGGPPQPLGFGDAGHWWFYPESPQWSWQIPAGTAGATLSVECAPMVDELVPVTYRGNAFLSSFLSWVCASWMTDGWCLDEPAFRASWTIAAI